MSNSFKNMLPALRPCLKKVKTPKRWILIRHSALNVLAGRQPGKKVCLDWRKNLSPLGIPPFFKQGLEVCHLSNKVKSFICLIALLSFPKSSSHLFQFLHLSHIQPFLLADRVYRRPTALLPLAFNNIRESLGLIFGNILQHLRLY